MERNTEETAGNEICRNGAVFKGFVCNPNNNIPWNFKDSGKADLC